MNIAFVVLLLGCLITCVYLYMSPKIRKQAERLKKAAVEKKIKDVKE